MLNMPQRHVLTYYHTDILYCRSAMQSSIPAPPNLRLDYPPVWEQAKSADTPLFLGSPPVTSLETSSAGYASIFLCLESACQLLVFVHCRSSFPRLTKCRASTEKITRNGRLFFFIAVCNALSLLRGERQKGFETRHVIDRHVGLGLMNLGLTQIWILHDVISQLSVCGLK